MNSWRRFDRGLIPLPHRIMADEEPVQKLEGWKIEQEQGVWKASRQITAGDRENGGCFLRMHQVGCDTEVFLDGVKTAEHYGGYTDWDVPLEGEEGERTVTLCMRDGGGKLNPFEKAGTFGGVSLVRLPRTYLSEIQTKTEKEASWRLTVLAKLGGVTETDGLELSVCLEGENGREALGKFPVESRDGSVRAVLDCPAVREWDTEHPVLYELTLTLCRGGVLLEEARQKVGFAAVRVLGQQVYWNEQPLKLRGLCYREQPGVDEELLKKDLKRFKEAGVNYLRSLFYPFSSRLLGLCDQEGILVCQSASAFSVGRSGPPTQDLPDCRALYAGQFSELVRELRSHVSGLLISPGTECVWGSNFRVCASMARELAPELLLAFSYPMTIPAADLQPDVWCVQYVDWKQPFDVMYDHMEIGHANGSENEAGYVTGHARRQEKPVLHDLYAPLPFCNRDEIERDYGIHEFWGESIWRFQRKMEETPGALGGSVLGACDEDGSFSPLLEDCEWGILDKNHEPKPEYFHLKKAFEGWKTGIWPEDRDAADASREASGADDEAERSREACGDETGEPYKLTETPALLTCQNGRFALSVSKTTGLLDGVWAGGEKVIENGPWLTAERLLPGEWEPEGQQMVQTAQGVRVHLTGRVKGVCRMEYRISLGTDGRLETAYTVTDRIRPLPPRVKAQIGLDPGGLDEFGISYVLPASMRRLEWKREGLWEDYPADHIGRTQGAAAAENRLDFESMKQHIRDAWVTDGAGTGLRIFSAEPLSIRMKEEAAPECLIDDRDEGIRYHGQWLTMEDGAGDRNGTETASRQKGDFLEYTFCGTGIRVYGPVDHIGGRYHIFVDGRPVKERGSAFPKPVEIAAASRGYEKRYQVLMGEALGLEPGTHTVKVEVLGEKAPGGNDTWVSVDFLEVIREEDGRRMRMNLNRDFNYGRLVRGNYMRPPVGMREGKTNRVTILLTAKEEPIR